MKSFILIILLGCSLTGYSQGSNHGQDQTTPAGMLSTTRSYDALEVGLSNRLYLGGRDASGPIMWGAYPDSSSANSMHRFRYSNAPTARLSYHNWSQVMVFDFSQDANPVAHAPVTWQTRMSLTNEGNLYLCGNLSAKKVLVELSGWCDYVFQPDYTLMNLSDLERYLQQHRHLPGIPSEAELQTTGLDVAEMQTLHMQKIEELTLYVIDLHKKIQNLEAQLAALQKQ